MPTETRLGAMRARHEVAGGQGTAPSGEAVVRRYSYPALVDVAWCMRGSSLLQRRRGR